MPYLEDRRVRAALLAIILICCALLIGLRLVRTGSTYGGDSVQYFAQVRSLVMDRDLDLSNDFARFHAEKSAHTGNPKLSGLPPTSSVTGRPGTPFPVGTAILLMPFFLIGHLVATIAASLGGPVADGFGPIYSLACGMGALTYLGLTLALLLRVGRYTGQTLSIAFTGALGILLGTPWLYYGTLDPVYSHVYAAFAVTLFFWVLLARTGGGSVGWWLVLGGCGGLMGLVRYQDIAFVLLAPATLLWSWRDSLANPARSGLRLGALGLGVGAVFLIQLAANHYLFGDFFETGHRSLSGFGFDHVFAPRLAYTALSAQSGFLRWSPVIVLALVGVWLLRRRRALEAFLCGAGILGHWYVMSAWSDLSQGDSFGNRHFVSCTVFLAVGLMESIRVIGSRWPRLAGDVSRLGFLALLGVANLVLMVLYSYRIIGTPY